MGCAIVLREILTSAKSEIRLRLPWLFADRGGRNAHFLKTIRSPYGRDDAGVRVSSLLLNTRIPRRPVVVSGGTCDSELAYDVWRLSVRSSLRFGTRSLLPVRRCACGECMGMREMDTSTLDGWDSCGKNIYES